MVTYRVVTPSGAVFVEAHTWRIEDNRLLTFWIGETPVAAFRDWSYLPPVDS